MTEGEELNAAAWDARYREANTPWDLGGPTPVFTRLVREGRWPEGGVLVPGAGRGYDAVALAESGRPVTAVDLSARALADLGSLAASRGVRVELVHGDFFTAPIAGFDSVLEYTFFCALDPALRPAYARRMAEVLKPGGALVGLFFPIAPGTPTDGPPFSVDLVTLRGLLDPYFSCEAEEAPPDSIKPRHGRERLMIWRKR